MPSAISGTREKNPAQNFGSTPLTTGGLESFVHDMMEKMVEKREFQSSCVHTQGKWPIHALTVDYS